MSYQYPTISVIMPVFNGDKYISDAIKSILDQTYTNFEFIILNDGSTDKSEEIILSFDDPRIVYIKNENNLKIVQTLNKGIALAKGQYIARMDADDISLPKRFEKQIQFMHNNPDISICGTWVQTIGYKNKIWKYPVKDNEIKITLLSNSALAHPSVMIKKDFFDHFKYEEKYNKAEDYALWVKAMETHKMHNLPEPLLKYRLHPKQTNTEQQILVANDIRQMMLKKLDCKLDYTEIQMYMKILSKQYIPMHYAETIFDKLLTANLKSHLFDQDLLQKLLSQYFLLVFSLTTNKCLKTFYKFQTSSMNNLFILSPLIQIKLLVKCLMRHSHAQ